MTASIAHQGKRDLHLHIVLCDLVKDHLVDEYRRRFKFCQKYWLGRPVKDDEIKSPLHAMDLQRTLHRDELRIDAELFKEVDDPQLSYDLFRRGPHIFPSHRVEDDSDAISIFRIL